MIDRGRTALYGLALVAAVAISRLPQLGSSNLLLDGDECIVGLMARHAMRGEIPLFFWGQHYGLSTVEVLAGALSFATFGFGALQLKVAMLALWGGGVLCLFLALSRFVGDRRSFWVTMVFVLSPAWAVWSMKARGGYVTAFTASSVVTWTLVRRQSADTVAPWLLAGAMSAMVALAQPLWLPSVVPVVAFAALSSRRGRLAVAGYVGIAAGTVAPFALLSLANSSAWAVPAIGNPDVPGTAIRVAQQVYTNMTGSYYLGWSIDSGTTTRVLAVAWCAVMVMLAGLQGWRMAARRWSPRSHALFLGACATVLANWVLLSARDPRYLLPLSAPVVVLAGVELIDLVDRGVVSHAAAQTATAGALVLGVLSLWEFRTFNYLWMNPPGHRAESTRMRQVINSLTLHGVHHVFSMNGLLDTQIMFYSGEQVIARWVSLGGRHPAYGAEVNRALLHGEPVAVVGYTDTSGAPGCSHIPVCTGGLLSIVRNPETIFTVDDKYFVYIGADRDLLRQLHFDLPR